MTALIPKTASIPMYQNHLIYQHTRMITNPQTAPLADVIHQEIETADELLLEERKLNLNRTIFRAQADTQIAFCEETLRGISIAAKLHDHQNPGSEYHTTLFPKPISNITRQSIPKVILDLNQMITHLGLSLFSDDFRDECTEKITHAITRLQETQKQLAIIKRQELELKNKITAWKEHANAIRLTTYGNLLELAKDPTRAKSWATSFFMKAPKEKLSPEKAAERKAQRSEKAAIKASETADKALKAAQNDAIALEKLRIMQQLEQAAEQEAQRKIRQKLNDTEGTTTSTPDDLQPESPPVES